MRSCCRPNLEPAPNLADVPSHKSGAGVEDQLLNRIDGLVLNDACYRLNVLSRRAFPVDALRRTGREGRDDRFFEFQSAHLAHPLDDDGFDLGKLGALIRDVVIELVVVAGGRACADLDRDAIRVADFWHPERDSVAGRRVTSR